MDAVIGAAAVPGYGVGIFLTSDTAWAVTMGASKAAFALGHIAAGPVGGVALGSCAFVVFGVGSYTAVQCISMSLATVTASPFLYLSKH